MIINRCRSCGHEFLVKRVRCPSCHGEDFDQIHIHEGTVLDCVDLIATPEPFPDSYSIVLARTDNDVRLFCRSEKRVRAGTVVSISDSELGPVCSKK